ncbi:PH domain-containing protein [Candidatus Roizmanbacteria bacterium]|nr:PH domain-containing protein [Candidatus Roizmanbacteria bacterium]
MGETEKTSHDLFHSFCVRPDVRFDTQEDGEVVILMLRAHPITQLPWIISGIILIVLLIFANVVFFGFLTPPQILIINLYSVIFIASYLWLNFLLYFFNVGIVTNMKVLDIDFHMVLYKETTEARLDRIEDVTAKMGGYFASIFNFGDVFIQTAGTEANIEFLKVPRPSEVVSIVNKLGES